MHHWAMFAVDVRCMSVAVSSGFLYFANATAVSQSGEITTQFAERMNGVEWRSHSEQPKNSNMQLLIPLEDITDLKEVVNSLEQWSPDLQRPFLQRIFPFPKTVWCIKKRSGKISYGVVITSKVRWFLPCLNLFLTLNRLEAIFRRKVGIQRYSQQNF